jgi:hypothetical protein
MLPLFGVRGGASAAARAGGNECCCACCAWREQDDDRRPAMDNGQWTCTPRPGRIRTDESKNSLINVCLSLEAFV